MPKARLSVKAGFRRYRIKGPYCERGDAGNGSRWPRRRSARLTVRQLEHRCPLRPQEHPWPCTRTKSAPSLASLPFPSCWSLRWRRSLPSRAFPPRPLPKPLTGRLKAMASSLGRTTSTSCSMARTMSRARSWPSSAPRRRQPLPRLTATTTLRPTRTTCLPTARSSSRPPRRLPPSCLTAPRPLRPPFPTLTITTPMPPGTMSLPSRSCSSARRARAPKTCLRSWPATLA